MRDHAGPNCLVSGGEPTVELADPAVRGKGGRNQQLVLAAALALPDARGIAIMSAGTDGEDGPTDAAGAVFDATVLDAARRQKLDAANYLRRSDAYSFFAATGGLVRTGPTGTNVCDLRIVLVEQDRDTSH
jgi:glycerate-2-kinase